MLKLRCGVYGEGSVFSVDTDSKAEVEALRDAIAVVVAVPSRLVTLYLARKDDAWLHDDDSADAVLRGRPDATYKKMRSSWSVKEDCIGTSVQLGRKEIHVLVELPTPVAAAGGGLTPSAVPTATLHRHPERLKRWSAINAMIRQKNQDASLKKMSEDALITNKKRKNHDVDKSMDYLSLSWDDIKPIFDFDDSYELEPSDVPDGHIELLLARIGDLRTLYGQISDGKDAKRLFFIAPILETVSRLLGDVRILVEEDVVGKNVLLKGRFEFVLQRGTKRISIVEAKREDMQQGVAQNVMGLEALADVEELTEAYGIVTNFLEWIFLVSDDVKVRKHEHSLRTTNTMPAFAGLKDIVGKIHRILSNEQ